MYSFARKWIILLVAAGLAWGSASSLMPPTRTSAAQAIPDLKDTLEKGLKARLPREFAFIGLVVAKVESGELPLKVVLGTFKWARRKRPYPFPYFEFALRRLAAKLGVDLN